MKLRRDITVNVGVLPVRLRSSSQVGHLLPQVERSANERLDANQEQSPAQHPFQAAQPLLGVATRQFLLHAWPLARTLLKTH